MGLRACNVYMFQLNNQEVLALQFHSAVYVWSIEFSSTFLHLFMWLIVFSGGFFNMDPHIILSTIHNELLDQK